MKVLEVLGSYGNEDGVSQQQLIAATGLSERAVKYAVKELIDKSLILEETDSYDLRRRKYRGTL